MDLNPITLPEQTNYSCDTLPTPRLLRLPRSSRSPSPLPSPPHEDVAMSSFEIVTPEEVHDDTRSSTPSSSQTTLDQRQDEPKPQPQPPARKLCVRHQRMADEGINLKIQQVSNQC